MAAKKSKQKKKKKTPSLKKDNPTKPLGRPHIDLPKNAYEKMELLAGLGLTHEHIAILFDMSESSLERKMRTDDRLKTSHKRGKANIVAVVASCLFANAIMNNNVAAQIFIMKTQGHWKEKIDVTGTITITDEFKNVVSAFNKNVLPKLKLIRNAKSK